MLSEPYKAKIIQYLKKLTYRERLSIAGKYNYNIHKIPSEYILVDLYDERGNAMSEAQFAALMRGDEAYAGSKNFINIEKKVVKILGKRFVIPAHNRRGAEHLLFKSLADGRTKVLSDRANITLKILANYFGVKIVEFDRNVKILTNNLDESVAFIYLNSIDPEILKLVSSASSEHVLVLNASNIFSSAAFLKFEKKLGGDLSSIVMELADPADVLLLSATGDLFAHVGSLLITDDVEIYEKFRAWVVSFEGLHTYGGLAGRDMETIAEGFNEALNEDYWLWRYKEIKMLYEKLKQIGYLTSEYFDADGFYLKMENPIGFNLALFLSAQIRAFAIDDKLYIRPPKRTYFKQHYEYVLKAFEMLKGKNIPELRKKFQTDFNEAEIMDFEPDGEIPDCGDLIYCSFPYRVRGVELLIQRTREYRERTIEGAGYNTFLLRSEDVYIDLLTDSGTSAQSDKQWGNAFIYDGRNAYEFLKAAVREVLGFEHFIVTHQGRQAEHFISQALINEGQYVINNMYFTTTRFHQEYAGGIFVDMIVEEAHDPESDYPFKGNLDVDAIEQFIDENGADNIAYICVEMNVNMAGGQPVSMENLRKVREVCSKYNIPLVFDATRIAENAYFIHIREDGYHNRSIREIIKEMLSFADAATFSAKKDPLVNIGGLLTIRDRKIYEKICEFATAFDGTPYSGGLADRDIAMLASGLYEMTEIDYLKSRIEQVSYLGDKLIELGIPVVKPIGGHAVYLNAKKFLEHIPQDDYPAQVLSAEIYIEGGVRTMERGTVSAGRDPKTGMNRKPSLELVRITIPRRVYSNSHMDHVIESILNVWNRRYEIGGLEIVYETKFLRFFTARFKRK
jgi:tyrosine phenol-lyase